MEAGEHQGLVPVAGEGVGASAGDGLQSVDVGADRLSAAAPFAGLQEFDRQPSNAARASAWSSPETFTPRWRSPTTAAARWVDADVAA
ncbi:hypothetical protein [Streptomyces lavendulocolor]|uniref:hypothetical protein n=1 Tax=Streptomyces lavendulocolor TaxID=67316 RepID=UPI0031DBB6E5